MTHTWWNDEDVRGRLWQHVSAARWFSGKGRDGRLEDVVELTPVARVHHLVATVRYPDGSPEYYQVLVTPASQESDAIAVDPEGTPWRDATEDGEALVGWARELLEGHPVDPSGWWTLERLRPAPTPVRIARRFGGEQSNTSIEVDDAVIIKVFRRLEPGDNLDVTIHAALNRAGVTSVATLHGAVHAAVPLAEGDLRTDLAMIVQRLPQPRDGWEYVCAKAAGLEPVDDDCRALGSALAQIHDALAEVDLGSGPRQLRGDDVADLMVRRLDRATATVAQLEPLRPGLTAIFDRLRGRTLAAQPVHGDFHLGQTLLTPDGWRIIDFEGEPLKSAAERRAPDSPWRDVAGMTRSLSYATSATPDPSSPQTRAWATQARQAFLTGYASTIEAVDVDLLSAYEADKAIYEVVYEFLNRPDWIEIPLGALRSIAASGSHGVGQPTDPV
ncbi:phosphotransferase [Acidipropionibacterium timonense]|uniref:phosphotransferase n=1 Tax=Acidipropionibacterium timonense TaxID=2161818 RepID=UPI00102FB314|nr:phosphotransferase [Acidipropionibacterium timonense]